MKITIPNKAKTPETFPWIADTIIHIPSNEQNSSRGENTFILKSRNRTKKRLLLSTEYTFNNNMRKFYIKGKKLSQKKSFYNFEFNEFCLASNQMPIGIVQKFPPMYILFGMVFYHQYILQTLIGHNPPVVVRCTC
jgi:hypothetical protein